MEYLIIALALLLMLGGLIGSVLPFIPGPPLSFFSLLIAAALPNSSLDGKTLIIAGLATFLVIILELVIPIWSTKKYGGSKAGVWGATVGLSFGLFLFPPFGVILGPFFGALLGELLNNPRDIQKAVQASFGSIVGFLISTGLKLVVCIWMLIVLVKDLMGVFKFI